MISSQAFEVQHIADMQREIFGPHYLHRFCAKLTNTVNTPARGATAMGWL